MDDHKRLQRIEKIFDYTFKRPQLVTLALSHASIRRQRGDCNERLEFLGDSILGFVITDMLYRAYPEMSEGELTRFKGSLVSRRTLAILARDMKLGSLVVVGHGIPQNFPDSLLANVFEALVGAWYLDGGLSRVKKWLKEAFESRVDMILKNRHERNHKSILQQFSQKVWRKDPKYICLSESGPPHSKIFCFRVDLEEGLSYEGEGSNRKQAQQKAAGAALRALKRRVQFGHILSEISG